MASEGTLGFFGGLAQGLGTYAQTRHGLEEWKRQQKEQDAAKLERRADQARQDYQTIMMARDQVPPEVYGQLTAAHNSAYAEFPQYQIKPTAPSLPWSATLTTEGPSQWEPPEIRAVRQAHEYRMQEDLVREAAQQASPIGAADILFRGGPENFAALAPLIGKTQAEAGQYLSELVPTGETAEPRGVGFAAGAMPTSPLPVVEPRYATLQLHDAAAEQRAEAARQRAARDAQAQLFRTYSTAMGRVFNPAFQTMPADQQQGLLKILSDAQAELYGVEWPSKPLLNPRTTGPFAGMTRVYELPSTIPGLGQLAALATVTSTLYDRESPFAPISANVLGEAIMRWLAPGAGGSEQPGTTAAKPLAPATPTRVARITPTARPGALPTVGGFEPPEGVPTVEGGMSGSGVRQKTSQGLDIETKRERLANIRKAKSAPVLLQKEYAAHAKELDRLNERIQSRAFVTVAGEEVYKLGAKKEYTKRTPGKVSIEEAHKKGLVPDAVWKNWQSLLTRKDRVEARMEEIRKRLGGGAPTKGGVPTLSPGHAKELAEAIKAEAWAGTAPGKLGPKVRQLIHTWNPSLAPGEVETIWRDYAERYYYPNARRD